MATPARSTDQIKRDAVHLLGEQVELNIARVRDPIVGELLEMDKDGVNVQVRGRERPYKYDSILSIKAAGQRTVEGVLSSSSLVPVSPTKSGSSKP